MGERCSTGKLYIHLNAHRWQPPASLLGAGYPVYGSNAQGPNSYGQLKLPMMQENLLKSAP
eukprot:1157645-Pelagomonas_calceolata.AAC.7